MPAFAACLVAFIAAMAIEEAVMPSEVAPVVGLAFAEASLHIVAADRDFSKLAALIQEQDEEQLHRVIQA